MLEGNSTDIPAKGLD